MRRLFLVALLVTLGAWGCIRPHPKTTSQAAAPLDVPPAPPRVIAQVEDKQPPEETTTEEPEPAKEKPRTHPRTQPLRGRPETAKPVETRPDVPPAETAKPPAATPPAPLQPALQASTVDVRRQVEAQLAQARRDIEKVDTRTLSSDARTQYDTAKQFIAQATTALKDGNLVFAAKLAEKAVGLASNLVPR